MSLDKAILYKKEYRKPYYRSGKFDITCRPGGACGWCKGNRLHSTLKRMSVANDTLEEFLDAPVTQWSEYPSYTRLVGGSTPPWSTKGYSKFIRFK